MTPEEADSLENEAVQVPPVPPAPVVQPVEPEPSDQSEEAEEEPEEETAGEEEEPAPGLTGYFLHGNDAVRGEYIYTGEVYNNTRGGISTSGATRYRGNLDLVLTFDSQAMGLWRGGQFFLYGLNTHGRTLSQDFVGDYQLYSNIDTSGRPADVMQVNEYWYLQQYGDGALTFKVGKQDATADFTFVDLGGDFVQNSFSYLVNVPTPTYPNPGQGVATFWQANERLRLMAGVYDGMPNGGQWGFDTLGHFGAFSIYQLEYRSQLGRDGRLPGTYRVGGWYHTGRFPQIAEEPTDLRGNHGFYALVDQMLWNESSDAEDGQGLGAFFQFSWAPEDRNLVDRYFGAGLLYRGLVRTRDVDTIGLGVANALFSDQLQAISGNGHETVTELFYKAVLSPYVAVQPDLQFIASPNGVERDALVVGVRFELVL